MWFELPSDLDDPDPRYHSSAERQTLLEDILWADDRWTLRRTRMAVPVGHGEKQSFLVFVSAEGENKLATETRLRSELGEVIAQTVPGAELTWVVSTTGEWLPDL
jgi:hypothetical protein